MRSIVITEERRDIDQHGIQQVDEFLRMRLEEGMVQGERADLLAVPSAVRCGVAGWCGCSPGNRYSPGLLCMMPPSAKIVVAVR
jgi:hypothetical protein